MSELIDSIVVGGGVVGLAIGRALAQSGHEVIVLERNARIGEETSARSSEVIHAGIYYPEASLKARLCVRGRELLYEYCARRRVPYRRCGKLIVATKADQHARLETLYAQARASGVHDIERLDGPRCCVLEPAVQASAALWSPSTGILDSHALMLALRGDLEAHGGSVAVLSEVTGGSLTHKGLRVTVRSADETMEFRARRLVNASGLNASGVAACLRGMDPRQIPSTHYAKGNYFTLATTSPFSHLVYPIPAEGGLGIHATLDLAGRTRFGPDVEWVRSIDYRVDPARAAAFYPEIRRYWPELPDAALQPAYAGIRPKITGPGQAPADFLILGPAEHGWPRVAHLFGIESPGLTAALAIAEHIAALVD